MKNEFLSQTLDKFIKLIKLLKNNGYNIEEIVNNLSNK